VHESGAADIQVEIRVDQTLIYIEGLSLAVTIHAHWLPMRPELITPEASAKNLMFNRGQVDESRDQPGRALRVDAPAE